MTSCHSRYYLQCTLTCYSCDVTEVLLSRPWLLQLHRASAATFHLWSRMLRQRRRGRRCDGRVVEHAAAEEIGDDAKAVRRVVQLREELVLRYGMKVPSGQGGIA